MRSLNSHVSVPPVYVHLGFQKQGSVPPQAFEKHSTDKPERHADYMNSEESCTGVLGFFLSDRGADVPFGSPFQNPQLPPTKLNSILNFCCTVENNTFVLAKIEEGRDGLPVVYLSWSGSTPHSKILAAVILCWCRLRMISLEPLKRRKNHSFLHEGVSGAWVRLKCRKLDNSAVKDLKFPFHYLRKTAETPAVFTYFLSCVK